MQTMIDFLQKHDYRFCVNGHKVRVAIYYRHPDGTVGYTVEEAGNITELRAILGY